MVCKLRRKGFTPGLDVHMLMPYNIMFRYEDALAKQMYIHTMRMSDYIAARGAGSDYTRLRYNPATIVFKNILRLQWFGAWINGPLISAKKDLCTGCGVCVNNCPSGNITIKDGRAHFGAKCTMCMSCAMRCPNDAVRSGMLNPWRVNGLFRYDRLVADDTVPKTYVNDETKGYFKLFRPYYERTDKLMREYEQREEDKEA